MLTINVITKNDLDWITESGTFYINTSNKDIYKQVRTNIGLADTLIPSSFIYLIYMGDAGPCDPIKIIFGYHVNS